MKKFIFDVDGTITPSRDLMTAEFKPDFLNFVKNNDVYLASGSAKTYTVEQVGEEIYNLCKRVYNCSGNDVWEGNENIFTNEWVLPKDAEEYLNEVLINSKYPTKTGWHFDHRPGMCNFSTVGRNADREERTRYVKFDEETDERNIICQEFKSKFPQIEARVGGETGIDIFPLGQDKSQILNDFDNDDEIHFFGDKMDVGGNDYPIARRIVDENRGFIYPVSDWKATRKILITLL